MYYICPLIGENKAEYFISHLMVDKIQQVWPDPKAFVVHDPMGLGEASCPPSLGSGVPGANLDSNLPEIPHLDGKSF